MAVMSCPKFATCRTAQSSGQARVLGCSFGRSFFTERFVAASVVDLFGGRRVPDYAAHFSASGILQQSRAERPLAEASPGLCCPSWSCTPTGRASACQRLMLVAAFQGLGAMLRFRQIVAQEQRRSCGPQPRKIPPRSAVMILQKTYLAGGGHSSMLRDMESTTPAKPLHNCQTSSCCHFSSQFLLFFRYSC